MPEEVKGKFGSLESCVKVEQGGEGGYGVGLDGVSLERSTPGHLQVAITYPVSR